MLQLRYDTLTFLTHTVYIDGMQHCKVNNKGVANVYVKGMIAVLELFLVRQAVTVFSYM